ncbi:MAG: hypothetical protein WCY23_02720 [Candidatus Omnitrophota bacterium]
MRNRIVVFCFFALQACIIRPVFAQGVDDSVDTLLWDGLESKAHWSINTKGELGVGPEFKTEGQNCLSISSSNGIPANGLTIKKSNTDLDVTFAKNIILDIYNSGPPCDLAVAFKTDGIRESVPKRIESGLNKNVTFEISTKDFKVPFGDANIATDVMFVVYPKDSSVGQIYLDNIRIRKYGGLQSEPPGISPGYIAEPEVEPFTPAEAPEDAGTGGAYSILGGSSGDNNLVPEHKTIAIFGAGLLGLAAFRRKHFKK